MSNACSLDESESKSVHISVNTSEVKYAKNKIVNMSELRYAKNETNNEEPSIAYNSVINSPIYFKLFEFGKNLLKNFMPHVNECAWKVQGKSIIWNCVIK